MKGLVDFINEVKDDTQVTLQPWADFIAIDLKKDSIEFIKFDEVKNNAKLKALKVGESVMEDDIITVCLTDLSALDEK